jgi:tripartite ATP-independent transporter DctM subunit
MTEFLIANMAPIIFASMVVFLLVGFPVSFALAANGIFFGFVGIELGLLGPQLFQALPDRIFGIMNNDTLLAIPFFTFMGLILERSGMAEDLLDTIGQLFGPLRGGLALAVIFVGALLAATTGVVAASVISMGLISLPIMLRYGYDKKLASGVIAASGTLAQIIPPSLVLIIMADQLGKSVGDMYKGAFLPGMTLTAFYVGYVVLVAIFRPRWAPALPLEARTLRGGKLLLRVLTTLVPPLLLIFLVLGTIFLGIATPTEGGAMGATGALIMALARRRLSWKLLRQAMDTTAKLTTFVVFILVGARVFSLTFYGVDGHKWVEHLLTGLPGGEIGFLIVVNVPGFPARLLPRLLRAFVHRRATARAGCAGARHRSDLVWRSAGGQHADFVHAPAFWFCALLPALGGTGVGQDDRYLLGSDPLRLHPDHHGRNPHLLSATRHFRS